MNNIKIFVRKLFRYISHPVKILNRVISILSSRLDFIGDKTFILFRARINGFKYKMNLDNPQTFNEKLNWLKIHYREEKLTMMVDKYAVKEYVAKIIGDQYVVPCYGVYNSFDEIDFAKLPNKFVLKATNDSSGAIICKNKESFNKNKANKRLSKSLHNNFYWPFREWGYYKVHPQIIADQFLDDHSGHELTDYKFWCFNGEPRIMYITNKAFDIFENFYDMDFNPIHINHGFKRHEPEFEKPKNWDLMKELARKLSHNIPFVRVDFFNIDGKVYFGEYTLYDWAAMQPFESYEQDLELGNLIQLPN